MFAMHREYYLWTAAAGASTVAVGFAPDAITRLREVATGQVDVEIGGILLGRRLSEDQITIEDFELLPSEHRRGATFTLSQADRKKLLQRLRSSHNGLQSVGSFRTHVRQGLYMDQYDFEVMASHFAGSSDVMLLINPADWKAGVFLWEDGDIHRQKSYRQFPFDATLLPLTPIDFDESTAAVPASTIQAGTKPVRSWRIMPALIKIGLIAASFGLVGVVAHYAREHRSPQSAVSTVEPANRRPAPRVVEISPPVDPDVRADLSEMHVKVSHTEPRPSPFAPPPQPASQISQPTQSQTTTPQGAAPPPAPSLPPVQSQETLPPAVAAAVMLKPAPPTVVSMVSIEPTEPGALSRGINHIPIINLLQRHKYKAGEKFTAAQPIRQVKPRLPSSLQRDTEYPPVEVKVWIDKTGQVTKAELESDPADSEVGEIATNAALKWTFEPARLSDHPVSSEMIMHFRFAPPANVMTTRAY